MVARLKQTRVLDDGWRIEREGYPVNAVRLDGTVLQSFISCREAARAYGRNESVLRRAVEGGIRCGGVWWRYADMPAHCQPLIRPRSPKPHPPKMREWRKQVEYAGVAYPSIRAAARALGIRPNTMWKRLNKPKARARVRMWKLDPNYPATW